MSAGVKSVNQVVATLEAMDRVSKVVDNFTMICFDKCKIDYTSSAELLTKGENRCVAECTTNLVQVNQTVANTTYPYFSSSN